MSKRCMGCMELYSEELSACPHCGYAAGTQAEEAIQLPPGTRIQNRYIIGKSIRDGEFGTTYLGWDEKLGEKVAIKEYLPNEFSTRMPGRAQITIFNGEHRQQFFAGLRKFLQEAKILAKFKNERGIIRIFDSFEENSTAYIIMEYLEGETLGSYLERVGTIPEDQAVQMLTPVMESLQALHAAGILHRDIAPDNIFLTTQGEAKLVDFGASRYATTSYSRSLTVLVKSGYSPEEQYRSRGDQGPWTDVYALAGTLYKMITGTRPPDAMDRRAYFEKKNKDILSSPHRFNKYISVGREIAILNAMNARVEDRTQSISDFIKELNANPPAKRIHGKIKRLNFYTIPLWLKIVCPLLLVCILSFVTLMLTGVIDFSPFSEEIVIPDGVIAVPELEGLDKDEAMQKVANAHLLPATGGTVESVYIPAGRIVLQTPEGGTYVRRNSTVYLTISSGKKIEVPVEGFSVVPYVVWDSLEDACNKLKLAGMGEPILEEAYDDYVQAGHVVSQSVEANTKVKEKTVITLVISKGIQAFPMENVEGMVAEEAEELLTAQGLLVSIEYEKSNMAEENSVLRQSVAAGTDIKQGDTVTLVVCSGKETIVVPNVVGQEADTAAGVLKDQGFQVTVLKNYDQNVPAGEVISQSPDADSAQLPGSEITIYVSKGKKPYTVTFNGNGGSVSESSRTVYYKSRYGELPTASRRGYTFTGWYLTKDGSGRISASSLVERTSDHVLYAGWQVHTHRLTFDTNGGDTASSTVERKYDHAYGELPVPSRKHYRFEGWFTKQSGGSQVSSSTVMGDQDVTIYAHWSPIPYTVSFNGNGGSVSENSRTVYYHAAYGELPTATRTGYTFTGWYLTKDGSDQVNGSSLVERASDHVLYAGWKIHTHRLTFDTNGGDTGSSSVEREYDHAYGELPVPSRKHYKFEGWFTQRSGGSQVSSSTVMGDQDVTIYAHWSIIPYKVSWENGSNCTIAVQRTTSPNAGASTGTLSSGSTVYYGDVLKITYTVADGYVITEKGSDSIEVNGNVDGSQIYVSTERLKVTYRVLYRSVNGTDLGTSQATYAYGSTQTIYAAEKPGYYTPDSQSVAWDSKSSKDIVFYYEPQPVSNPDKSGEVTNYYTMEQMISTVTYVTQIELRNRTADSVEVRLSVTETIAPSFYCDYVRRIKMSVGGQELDDIKTVDSTEWSGQVNYSRSSGASTEWMTIPLQTTNATTVEITAFFYQTRWDGRIVNDKYTKIYKTWGINIPAY